MQIEGAEEIGREGKLGAEATKEIRGIRVVWAAVALVFEYDYNTNHGRLFT